MAWCTRTEMIYWHNWSWNPKTDPEILKHIFYSILLDIRIPLLVHLISFRQSHRITASTKDNVKNKYNDTSVSVYFTFSKGNVCKYVSGQKGTSFQSLKWCICCKLCLQSILLPHYLPKTSKNNFSPTHDLCSPLTSRLCLVFMLVSRVPFCARFILSQNGSIRWHCSFTGSHRFSELVAPSCLVMCRVI